MSIPELKLKVAEAARPVESAPVKATDAALAETEARNAEHTRSRIEPTSLRLLICDKNGIQVSVVSYARHVPTQSTLEETCFLQCTSGVYTKCYAPSKQAIIWLDMETERGDVEGFPTHGDSSGIG